MLKQVLSLVLVISLLFSCEPKEEATLLIHGGNIYTVNDSQSTVEAVATKGNKILFAGSMAQAEKYKGDNTQVIDLQGKTMTPGLIEGHGHFMGLGYNELNIDLLNTTSYQEMIDAVAEAVKQAEPGQWITGRGWHQSKWTKMPEDTVNGFQTHDRLSAVSPDNPVYLRHASGHAGFANAKAMEIAGVTQLAKESLTEQDVEGGEIFRDA